MLPLIFTLNLEAFCYTFSVLCNLKQCRVSHLLNNWLWVFSAFEFLEKCSRSVIFPACLCTCKLLVQQIYSGGESLSYCSHCCLVKSPCYRLNEKKKLWCRVQERSLQNTYSIRVSEGVLNLSVTWFKNTFYVVCPTCDEEASSYKVW